MQAHNSRVRFHVVAFMMALGGVTYLDRVAIGTLQVQIRSDLGLSLDQMSWVFSSFAFAYAIFEIPTAWWADRIGSRRVLTRIVVWWSAFTMLTGAAFSYWSMLALRWLFGMGEAGAWPNVGRIFSRWIPARERGRVQGIFFSGAHLAGGLTPAVVTWLATFLSWRWIFVVCGSTGLIWAIAFYRWFRDEPRDHPSVSAAERDFIEAGRVVEGSHAHAHWTRILREPGIVPLCIQYFANSYGYYFFITWLPEYLRTARGMADTELAIFAGLPMMLSAAADITGGMTTDFLARKLGVRNGYRFVGGVAYLLAAVVMAAGAAASDGQVSGLLIAIAGALSMFTLAPAWATALGIGGEQAGLMGAVMNTSGQIGSILSPLVLARIVGRTGDWSLPLYVLASLYAVAALCWVFVRPRQE